MKVLPAEPRGWTRGRSQAAGSRRTEVRDTLLYLCWRLLSAPGGRSVSGPHPVPPPFQPWRSCLMGDPSHSESLWLLLPQEGKISLLLKGSCDLFRLAWTIFLSYCSVINNLNPICCLQGQNLRECCQTSSSWGASFWVDIDHLIGI